MGDSCNDNDNLDVSDDRDRKEIEIIGVKKKKIEKIRNRVFLGLLKLDYWKGAISVPRRLMLCC